MVMLCCVKIIFMEHNFHNEAKRNLWIYLITQIHDYSNGNISSSLEALNSRVLGKFINHQLRKHVTPQRPISDVLQRKQSGPAVKLT